MRKIKINLKDSPYEALIGKGLLGDAGKHISKIANRTVKNGSSRCVVVTSPQVRKLWGETLEDSLRKAVLEYQVVEVADGERNKTMNSVEAILDAFVEKRIDRNSIVVALGGGVVGDMAGFAASIFMRGIPIVQVPTTLLAQVDAAIGGKTGVNLQSGKNLAGTFHQPQLVLIDPQVLSTLAEREYRAGIFEVVKCGAIRSRKLFSFIEKNRHKIISRKNDVLEEIIAQSVRIKSEIVAVDEREGDLRRVLNFGHTMGHALEAATSYEHFLHGEAVAWGMIAAASIGTSLGITPSAVSQKLVSTVLSFGSLPVVDVPDQAVMSRLKSDKKTVHDQTHFVLLKDIGKTVITNDVPSSVIEYGLHVVREAARLPRQTNG